MPSTLLPFTCSLVLIAPCDLHLPSWSTQRVYGGCVLSTLFHHTHLTSALPLEAMQLQDLGQDTSSRAMVAGPSQPVSPCADRMTSALPLQAMQVRDLGQDTRSGQSSPERAAVLARAVSLSAQAAKHAVHAVQTFTALAQICQVRLHASFSSLHKSCCFLEVKTLQSLPLHLCASAEARKARHMHHWPSQYRCD